jgi:hypothetical protein
VFDLAAEADQGHSAAVALVNTVELGERRSEQPEQLGREGLIAADALVFGDEAEQSPGVACGERRHGLQKVRRMSNGLYSSFGGAFVACLTVRLSPPRMTSGTALRTVERNGKRGGGGVRCES